MTARTYLILSLLVICGSLLFRWPVLSSGFTVDDYAQLSMMTGRFPTQRAPLDLFSFVANEVDNRALRAVGYLPWWSDPSLKVSLFRPLASALMWFDLRWLGVDAFAYHLHTVAWWLAMMAGLAAVLYRVLPPTAAWLALLLCAAHPTHSMFLGWIASRNAVVAAAFCAWGLWAQLRQQQTGWRWGRRQAAACFVAALAAGEYALMFLPYAFAHAVLYANGFEQRRKRVLIWGSGAIAYLALRAALGFGARGSAMYVDPLREPLVVLASAPERIAVLAGDFVLALRAGWWHDNFPWGWRLAREFTTSDRWLSLDHWRWVQLAFGLIAVALWMYVTARARDPRVRFARWGLPCCLLPALCTYPEDRLLLPALLGWSILLLQAAASAFEQMRAQGSGLHRARFAGLCGLWLIGCGLRPVYTLEEQPLRPRMAAAIQRSILAPELDGVLGQAQRALLLSATDPTTSIYIPLMRRFHGRPGPATCQLLSSTAARQLLLRTDHNSFVLTRLDDEYTALDAYTSVFHRGELQRKTYSVEPGFQVTVEDTDRGRPQRARFVLDLSLDDPRVVLLTQTEQGLKPVRFPPVGGMIKLEPPRLPGDLMPPEP